MPSLTFSAESDEALKQLLTTAPQAPSDSKVKNVENYSPVVDLRSSRATIDYTQNPPFPDGGSWSEDTTYNINLESTSAPMSLTRRFVVQNDAHVTMHFNVARPYDQWDAHGILAARQHHITFSGDGLFDIVANITGSGSENPSFIGVWDASSTTLSITSKFKFVGKGQIKNFFVLFATNNYGDGRHVFNSPSIEIDMSQSSNSEKYILNMIEDYRFVSTPKIYFNTDTSNPNQAQNVGNILKLSGDIKSLRGNLYAHFTNSNSFLKGNLTLESNARSSIISFSNGSFMKGNIDIKNNASHSISFTNASFEGTVKNSAGNNNSANTAITFKNTNRRTFGNGTDDIVASSYKGTIVGNFDMSATAGATINGGASGDKGFFGSGTNTLTFDFRNDAKSGLSSQASKQFTIGGGNANSVYVMNAFQQKKQAQLDLTTLNSSSTLYNKLSDAGINIKSGASFAGANSDNVLQGTLLFKNTNIKVGTGNQALFALDDNIVGSTNALNNLAMGAMFGNATWNDANKDGYITANEITANTNGANYKLSNGSSPVIANGQDANTSMGDIGNTSDNIKKHIGFIFTDGTYDFGGDTQGYSGTIKGGTNESKYYFANAGYITRTQINNALGDLVLFNTAFRGDLGVDNDNVTITLDFSGGKNGLRAERGNDNANIVGAGSKNITFNFTDNTKQVKYAGAVVGDATKDNTDPSTGSADSQTANFTILNLVKNSSDGVVAGDGSLSVSSSRAGASKTLMDALRESGLTNFDKTDGNGVNSKGYGPTSGGGDGTDIQNLSTSNTILALRGTSLDTTGITFDNYIYDFAFGEGFGNIEGIAINSNTLKGDINLTNNSNTGHKLVFKGNALGNATTTITFGSNAFGTNGASTFIYDDSTATYSAPKTLKLSGLSQTNYLATNSSINISKTSLEGNLWVDNSSAVNLNFTNGRTWKMDESGFNLASGSNIIIHGNIAKMSSGDITPTLRIKNTGKLGTIQLINTGADARFNITSGYDGAYAQSFYLRGTSFKNFNDSNTINRIAGVVDNGTYNMVFAKGTNLQTTVMNSASGGTAYNITDEGVNNGYVNGKKLSHTGNYSNGVYDGNYIAQSSGAISGFNSNSGFNLTFIGEQAWDTSTIAQNNFFKRDSSFTLVNASNAVAFDATNIGNFFKRSGNDIGVKTTINIEGTSIQNGNNIVGRTDAGQQALLTYNMTFVKGTTGTYVSDTSYSDIATTTTANGALSDSVLKVAQSSLTGGINFQNSNFNVLFVGDNAQQLNNTNIFQGGSATSSVIFRDSNLNAGSVAADGTTFQSSLRDIAGTITFDLSHANEDMSISGTLSNMFAGNGHYQTKFGEARGDNIDSLTFDNLVFVSMNDVTNANALTSLKSNGNYFGDKDTFGDLSQKDFSKLGYISDLNTSENSSLTFGGGEIALNGTNQEIYFIGANSHGFDAENSSATKLGNSTGSTLTFIDAGTLKIANLLNIDTSGDQGGSGTINLIGNTKIEKTSVTRGSEQKDTLSLYKTTDATGNGITINAVFSGSNALASGNSQQITGGDNSKTGASTYDIGQTGEQTTYHLLFDYSSSGLTFGEHHAYTGSIYGLTSDSVIKFKNAGYIDQSQIVNTQATILVDNTQIRGDFTGDSAILDFRNDHPAISGKILTSDKNNTNLSQKTLTFDLTGSTKKPIFSGAIQAGYKIAPDYNTNGQSVLTFQNASVMTLGNDNGGSLRGAKTANGSAFIQSLASDVGFSGIANAEIEESNYPTSGSNASYILKGTKLVFQGTSITASGDKAISENLYELDLSFDQRADGSRGKTGLDMEINKSTLTANSIIMGEYDTSKPLGLTLDFKDSGSLVASNGLNVKLKEGARFNLSAESSNGNIGTIILSQNDGGTKLTKLDNVSKDSTLDISAGSMSFIGNFSQNDTFSGSGTSVGAINVAFNGDNKVFGTIAGRGEMNVSISGNAIVDNTSKTYDWAKTNGADVYLDASNATSGSITLAHTSGTVGAKGKAIASGTQTFTTLNMNDAQGNVVLSGAFDLGQANITLTDSKLKVSNDTFFKVSNNSAITLADSTSEASKTLTINATGGSQQNWKVDLTLTNLDPDLTVKLTNLSTNGTFDNWNDKGVWNIRGTNINIDRAFWSNSGVSKTFVFAKGSGTEVTHDPESQVSPQDATPLTLSQLTGADKINASSLNGNITSTSSGGHSQGIAMKGSFTFIGKEALGLEPNKQNIDGMKSDSNNGDVAFNLYNSLLKNGSILLDKTTTGNMNGQIVTDTATLRGTDTFNLSVSKSNGSTGGANNSTINAIFVNGTTTATSTDASITGVRYIDSSASYASAYATSNAGGALSDSILKTLESKAYGNITLDNGVTATMKFIGENSHSFDGKTKVDNGNVYYSANGQNDWKQYEIDTTGTGSKVKGAVYLGTTTTTSGTLATLTGGNANSRFDFDHTSVKLDLIKNAGGNTYIYNSNIVGDIGLSTAPTNTEAKSTTIIFNAKMTMEQAPQNRVTPADQVLSLTSQAYIKNHFADELGINIDFSTAHQMVQGNLSNGGSGSVYTLADTKKATNLVFIGKDSVNTGNTSKIDNSGESIDLSFLKNIVQGSNPNPDTMGQSGYSFTFIDAGKIDGDQLAEKVIGDGTGQTDPSNAKLTVFGTAKVQLVNTIIVGARNFSQVGFIDTGIEDNLASSWGGGKGIDQFLIFDFYEGANNQNLNNGSANAINNSSTKSHFIFTNFGTKSVTLSSPNSLKTSINDALQKNAKTRAVSGANPVISDAVNGYLGLRGVSIIGNIEENSSGGNGGNSVDIVFNSTDNISYIDGFDTSGNHTSKIIKGKGNYVAVAEGDTNKISGKATLEASTEGGIVEIKGDSNKHITFIGAGAVKGGFDKLKISAGGNDSIYRFYEVGSLNQEFLNNVGLYNDTQTTATAGTFVFENTTISGNINANQNSARTTALDPNTTDLNNVLVFDNVAYKNGTISGSLIKNLKFAKGTDNVTIEKGDEHSVYDFSNLAGETIHLNINMENGTPATYLNPTFVGFNQGDISVIGSLKAGDNTSFAFNNSASWTVTGDSRVNELTLNNTGLNYNLDLASATRTTTKTDSKDLRVLEVENLTSDGGQVLLGTIIDESSPDNSKSDKINASVINGTLYVTAQDVNIAKGNFEDQTIVLVTADTNYGEVKGAERKQGLSYVSTKLEHQTSADSGSTWSKVEDESSVNPNDYHRWILKALNAETNQELVDESGFIVSNPYRMLMIETNNLNKRMGDLRDDDYNQGAWIRVFNGMDSGEGAKNLYTNIQLGYDYGTPAIGAKNYTGVAFSTSIVDIDGNQYSGKANTYSLGVYNAYIADSGLYVDTIAKYLYTDQKLGVNGGGSDDSFGSHALSLGVEVGYRAYMGETNFYFEPQAEVIGGMIFGVKDINMGVIGGMNVTGELKTTTAINTRVGLVQGYSLKTENGFRADFRLGASLVNEFISESDPVRLSDGITNAGTSIGNDVKVVVNVGTNLILTDQWRVYIDAERSFGGNRNTDYQANVGARFSFGDKLISLAKPEKSLPLKVKENEQAVSKEEKKTDNTANTTEQKAQ